MIGGKVMKEYTITKDAIANAFKELMKTKSFDKISISDITNSCKLNRQTFYYHFQDKYELMNWIYYNEIFLPLVDNLSEETYQEKFEQMFIQMKDNIHVYQNALSSNNEYGFENYLISILEELVLVLLDNKKNLDTKFCTYGLSSVIIDWVRRGMKESPQELAKWMSLLLINFKKMF